MNQNIQGRRNALKLLALAGVTAVGGYALLEYAPWLNDTQSGDQTRRPLEQNTSGTAQMRELVRFAALAASGHNTQPWKFAIQENVIEIHPDLARHLPAVDPDDRELWISLGCALENLLVAARASGLAAEVTYPDSADVIRVRLTRDTPQASPLLAAILTRQNTRSVYDGQPIQSNHLERLRAVTLEPGVRLQFRSSQSELETVLEYVNQGNLKQYADPAFLKELVQWVRFDKREALASLDGLYSRCSGNPAVPRWLGQMVVTGTKPQGQADSDAKKLRSSSGAVIVTSASDDKPAWVRVGQVYERLALEMTALNIKSAFLNQPIEVSSIRGQFQTAMGLEKMLPQLLVRFGYADTMPRSLRRGLDQILL